MRTETGPRPQTPVLETKRLRLRPFTPDDVENYFLLNAHPEVVRYVGRTPLDSLQAALDMMRAAPLRDYRQHGIGRLACVDKESGRLIGFCGLKYVPEIDEVDIGYRFLPEYWGRGLASEACTTVMDYGREQLGLTRIVGIVDPANLASTRVLQKLGLAFERKIRLSFCEVTLDLYA